VTVTGVISKQTRPNNQGSYYQLTTESGTELAVSMTESTKPADDAKVLGPLVGKNVEVDGIIRKNAGELMAFSVKELP
jgi:hypothetical protein